MQPTRIDAKISSEVEEITNQVERSPFAGNAARNRAAMALMNLVMSRRAINRVKVAIIRQQGQQCPWPGTKDQDQKKTKRGSEYLMSQYYTKGKTKLAAKVASCCRKSQSATFGVIVASLQLIICQRDDDGENLHSFLWLSFCDFSSPFFDFPAEAAASAECKTVRP